MKNLMDTYFNGLHPISGFPELKKSDEDLLVRKRKDGRKVNYNRLRPLK